MTFAFVAIVGLGAWFVSRIIISYFRAKRESDKDEVDREREQADWDATARALHAQRSGEHPSAVVDEDAWFTRADALEHDARVTNIAGADSPVWAAVPRAGTRRGSRDARRAWWSWLAAGAVLLALFAGAAFMLQRPRPDDDLLVPRRLLEAGLVVSLPDWNEHIADDPAELTTGSAAGDRAIAEGRSALAKAGVRTTVLMRDGDADVLATVHLHVVPTQSRTPEVEQVQTILPEMRRIPGFVLVEGPRPLANSQIGDSCLLRVRKRLGRQGGELHEVESWVLFIRRAGHEVSLTLTAPADQAGEYEPLFRRVFASIVPMTARDYDHLDLLLATPVVARAERSPPRVPATRTAATVQTAAPALAAGDAQRGRAFGLPLGMTARAPTLAATVRELVEQWTAVIAALGEAKRLYTSAATTSALRAQANLRIGDAYDLFASRIADLPFVVPAELENIDPGGRAEVERIVVQRARVFLVEKAASVYCAAAASYREVGVEDSAARARARAQLAAYGNEFIESCATAH